MKAAKLLTHVGVVISLILTSGQAAAQSSRDLASSKIAEGKAYLDAAQYADAASSFESVVLDMDDSEHEFSDLRAVAGVFLCLARAKNNQLDAARAACNRVLEMPDAPQAVKDQATKLLSKLN